MKQRQQNITKAVVTCGGYATRFLPISKAIPKEMLPIGAKPVIHFIVEELVNAGIKDILILVGRGRETLLDYFDKNYEVDDFLKKQGDDKSLNFFDNVNIYYKRVPLPKGAADCVSYAKNFINGEHFLLAYCDDVYFNGNPSRELIDDFEIHKKPVLVAVEVPISETGNYGIISPQGFKVRQIVEKPKNNPPSNLAASGRYLLGSDIFDLIEQDRNSFNEICMTRQLNKLCDFNRLRSIKTKAVRFDTGTPEGLYKANTFIIQSETVKF